MSANDSAKKFNRGLDIPGSNGAYASTKQGKTLGYTPLYPLGAFQSLSGAGAIDVISFLTKWTTTGVEAGTLADGTMLGQLKKVQMIVDGGDGTLTPSNFIDGATITFADAGDFVILQWQGFQAGGWRAVETGNDADGATAPAIA